MSDGSSSIGSATGLPAPNAGTVGNAPTFDVGKRRRRAKRRVRMTKSAAFEAGVHTGLEKTALNAGAMIFGGLSAGAAMLAVYDLIKTRGSEEDSNQVHRAITSGKRVDSAKFIKKIDPKIKYAHRQPDIYKLLRREPLISEPVAKALSHNIARDLERGTNAFALSGERGDYIFAPPQTGAQVLAHEIGHILDHRAKGINIRNRGEYERTIGAWFWKPTHERQVMTPEREAWRQAPGRRSETKLERSALGTYEKGFHKRRARMAIVGSTLAALPAVALAFQKAAATQGEREVEESAPGLGSTEFVGGRERMERRSGNQGQRGIPEWLRMLKHLPSKATWNAGDKIGPREDDVQFHVPGVAS